MTGTATLDPRQSKFRLDLASIGRSSAGHWRQSFDDLAAAWDRLASFLSQRFLAAMLLTVTALFLTTSVFTPGPVPKSPVSDVRHVSRDGQGYTANRPGRDAPWVQPLVFANVDGETARDLNATIPFAILGADRPAPFRLAPASAGFARALDCLASAVLYEAGDDRKGQAAVAQVVLNRMRHPAFPHSVCAVVYQGSERTTGCQFTFTCDGALRRTPSPSAWQRARETAAAFLAGETHPAVGMATHYHTDWVYPYWSGTLDKIARADTHLFFRWRGGWGRKAAFTSSYADVEPFEPKLALLSPAHRDQASPQLAVDGPAPLSDAPERPIAAPGTLAPQDGDHFILVDGGSNGNGLAMQGIGECQGQPYCKVVGWDRRSQGHGSPQNPVIRTVAFLYVSDKRTGVEIVLWDCARFNRPSETQCLSDKNRRWISFQGNLSRAS